MQTGQPRRWYLAKDKQKLGPFSTQQLMQMIVNGTVQSSDMVLEEGQPKWQQAGTVKGIWPKATPVSPSPSMVMDNRQHRRFSPDTPNDNTSISRQTPKKARVEAEGSPQAAEWFYRIRGNESGPVSFTQLEALAKSGELQSTDLVWTDDMAKFTPASEIKGLFSPATDNEMCEHKMPQKNQPVEMYPVDQPLLLRGVSMPAVSRREHIYYETQEVQITRTRAIFSGKTFSLGLITSVQALEIPPNRNGPISFLFIGFSILLFLVVLLVAPVEIDFCFVSFLIASLAAITLGIVWFLKQKLFYAIVLSTAAGETKAYFHWKERIIDRIVHAINQAIIDRG